MNALTLIAVVVGPTVALVIVAGLVASVLIVAEIAARGW